jgi:tripartite-type tricarboxylate transporter receptor subunit TctC
VAMENRIKTDVSLLCGTQGISRRDFLRISGGGLAGAALLGIVGCGGGGGQADFPSETIEMIIPYDPGGSTDVSVRRLASVAEDTCGTNVIASNQTGSAGAVGFTAVANSEPNGYTVGATATELAYLYQFGITEVRPEDFKGIMRYALNPHVFYVPADSPYKTIDDAISAAEGGEKINVATSGTGSVYHLAFAGMALEAGVPDQFVNVPFDGGAPAVQAAVAGEVDMNVAVFQEAASQVESGRLRPLTVAGEERVEAIPDTPTLRQEGIDWVSASHLGLAVPVETPDDIVQTLSDCYKEAFDSDEFQQAMEEQNLALSHLPPQEFDQYLQELSDQYSAVIEELNIQGPEE